ncbi:MAG: MerR family transcriptional regulator, partial [Candidatus Omnitrophica bacterium]|nr:MerR family transcriptional regulator [Candidatus Omnitrophota bacterium]
MEYDYKAPVYTIGIVAKMIGVCPATLRIWERKKLIKPSRIGKNRFYSKCDLDRLEYIKELLQEKRI